MVILWPNTVTVFAVENMERYMAPKAIEGIRYGMNIADQLAEDGSYKGSHNDQFEAVAQHLVKLRVDQHPRFAVENLLYAFSRPVMKGQVGQAEISQLKHQTLQDQNADGQNHRTAQEDKQGNGDGHLPLSQGQHVGASALAADGSIGFTRAQRTLIDEDDHCRDGDQNQADGVSHSGLLLLDATVEHGGDGVIADLHAQEGRHAKGAHRF